ncbi:MAG: hypothetical protein ACOC16_03995 [Nanoarchaeota archaeon]
MNKKKTLINELLKYDVSYPQLISFLEIEILQTKANIEKMRGDGGTLILNKISTRSGINILEYNLQNRSGESIVYGIFKDPEFVYADKLLKYCEEYFR